MRMPSIRSPMYARLRKTKKGQVIFACPFDSCQKPFQKEYGTREGLRGHVIGRHEVDFLLDSMFLVSVRGDALARAMTSLPLRPRPSTSIRDRADRRDVLLQRRQKRVDAEKRRRERENESKRRQEEQQRLHRLLQEQIKRDERDQLRKEQEYREKQRREIDRLRKEEEKREKERRDREEEETRRGFAACLRRMGEQQRTGEQDQWQLAKSAEVKEMMRQLYERARQRELDDNRKHEKFMRTWPAVKAWEEERERQRVEEAREYDEYMTRLKQTVGQEEFHSHVQVHGLDDLKIRFKEWEWHNWTSVQSGFRPTAWGDHGKEACYRKIYSRKRLGMSAAEYGRTLKEDENLWIFPNAVDPLNYGLLKGSDATCYHVHNDPNAILLWQAPVQTTRPATPPPRVLRRCPKTPPAAAAGSQRDLDLHANSSFAQERHREHE